MSTSAPQQALRIAQGKTFSQVYRRGAKPYTYVPISAITQAAPARVTCSEEHNLPDGWLVAVVSVKGMKEINAENTPPTQDDYTRATVVDTTKVDLFDVNAADFHAYTSGGYLQFYTPVTVVGGTARMTIRDRIGGTALLSLDSAGLGGIVLDSDAQTITVSVDADTTAAMTWTKGVYELEFEDAGGDVKGIARGTIVVDPKEIAT